CGFPAPGSSAILASAIEPLALLDIAITRREVGMFFRLSKPGQCLLCRFRVTVSPFAVLAQI
ncbi:hypothetical protein L6R21_28000, partial [bacterium]|nr:hypothetical protein [bacterium]